MAGAGKAPTGVMRLPEKVLRIGRAEDNDIAVPDLRASRRPGRR
jgi:pSer/pThr/pTyr-binding forkhead associated (FHA) protein